VSTNSLQAAWYERYYRPNNYTFNDIVESLSIVNAYGGWSSINYFVFPGMNDTEAEYEALRTVIRTTNLKMIQWRNFNIDPDWYLGRMGITEPLEMMGIRNLMQLLHDEFPHLKFGYYNPPMERIKGAFEQDYAR